VIRRPYPPDIPLRTENTRTMGVSESREQGQRPGTSIPKKWDDVLRPHTLNPMVREAKREGGLFKDCEALTMKGYNGEKRCQHPPLGKRPRTPHSGMGTRDVYKENPVEGTDTILLLRYVSSRSYLNLIFNDCRYALGGPLREHPSGRRPHTDFQ